MVRLERKNQDGAGQRVKLEGFKTAAHRTDGRRHGGLPLGDDRGNSVKEPRRRRTKPAHLLMQPVACFTLSPLTIAIESRVATGARASRLGTRGKQLGWLSLKVNKINNNPPN